MKVSIDKFCDHCGARQTIKVDRDAYTEWKNGRGYIQDLLHENTAAEREMLISGCCGDCWDSMFSNVWSEDEIEDN